MERHAKFVNNSLSDSSRIKIVFTGSSSIEFWNGAGKEIWDSKYAPLGAVNYGIGGDQTQHTIWRIENGELQGLKPKLVIIYVGSNNVPGNSNNDEIVQGVNATVTSAHNQVPEANILLVGFFPRGDVPPVNTTLHRIVDISSKLKPIVHEDKSRRSYFLDIFDSLAPPTLDRIYEEFYQGDKLHLNTQGYVLWDKLMNSTFYQLIQ